MYIVTRRRKSIFIYEARSRALDIIAGYIFVGSTKRLFEPCLSSYKENRIWFGRRETLLFVLVDIRRRLCAIRTVAVRLPFS